MWKRYGIPSFYMTVVFVCGLAVGAFGHYLYETRSVSANVSGPRSPEQWKQHHLKELQRRLKLTDEQVSKVSAILEETHGEMRQLMDKTKPEMDRIQKSQYAKMRTILTPEQADEYEKLRAERDRRREREGKHF